MSSTLPIKIPNVGDINERVMVVDWYVTVGKFVNKGDLMALLETSRSLIEVFSPVSGYVKTIIVPRGKYGREGDNIVWVEIINKDDVALISNKLANRITTMINNEGIDKAYTAGASASVSHDERKDSTNNIDENLFRSKMLDVATVNFLDKTATNIGISTAESISKPVFVENNYDKDKIDSYENYDKPKDKGFFAIDFVSNSIKHADKVSSANDFAAKPISISTIQFVGKDSSLENNVSCDVDSTCDSDKRFISFNSDEKLRHDTFFEQAKSTVYNTLRGEILLNKFEVKDNFLNIKGAEVSLDAIFGKAIALSIADFNIFAARLGNSGVEISKSPKILFRKISIDSVREAIVEDTNGKTVTDIDINLKDKFKTVKDFSSSLANVNEAHFTFVNNIVDGVVSSDIMPCYPEVATLVINKVANRVFVIDINQVVVLPCINFSLTYDCKVVDDKVATNFFINIKDFVENPYFL